MKFFVSILLFVSLFVSSLALSEIKPMLSEIKKPQTLRQKINFGEEILRIRGRATLLEQKIGDPTICKYGRFDRSKVEKSEGTFVSRAELNHYIKVLFYQNLFLNRGFDGRFEKSFLTFKSNVHANLEEINSFFVSFWSQSTDDNINLNKINATFKVPNNSLQMQNNPRLEEYAISLSASMGELVTTYLHQYHRLMQSNNLMCKASLSHFFSIQIYSNFGFLFLSKNRLVNPAFRESFSFIEKNLTDFLNQLPVFGEEVFVGTVFSPSYLNSLASGDLIAFNGFLSGSYGDGFNGFAQNTVLKIVKNKSGKLVAFYSSRPDEREILWYKPKFKVLKIERDTSNKTWITVEEI
jgi:hypothetical protein